MELDFWQKKEIATAEKKLKALQEARRVFNEQKQRREVTERIAIGLAIAFGILIVALAWITEGKVIHSAVEVIRRIEASEKSPSASDVINCRHEKNKNTPYCLERKAKVEAQWDALKLGASQAKHQFSLHGNKYDRR